MVVIEKSATINQMHFQILYKIHLVHFNHLHYKECHLTQDIACMCLVNKSNNIVAKNKYKKSKKYKHVNIHGTNTK